MSVINTRDYLNTQGSEAGGRKTGSNELSKDDFMRLFLTQMKTQSPLKPFDSGDMMKQMSELTSLSATQELEMSIKQLVASTSRSQMLSASQLIGKDVVLPSGVGQVVEGKGMKGSVILPASVEEVSIEIKDDNGKLLKTVKLPASGGGVADFEWDGLDEDGNAVDADFYKMSATAMINGHEVQVQTAGNFKVNSVAMDPGKGSIILNLDGIGGVDFNNIIKIV